MIPILFEADATDFRTNGIGRLTECMSCLVTEQRNGIYECAFTYPVTGALFSEIVEGRHIVVTHDERGDKQPFILYARSAPINGMVTFSAHHVSYKASDVIVPPMTATSVAEAFGKMQTTALTSNPFTLWTDKTSSGSFSVKVPSSIRKVLGGTEGSVLDTFGGGEYEWDKYTIKLFAHRGTDRGVTIRYGKNLTDLLYETDAMGLYNAVIPYWQDTEGNVVYGSIVTATAEDVPAIAQAVRPLDLSSDFTETPTAAQLEARAAVYLTNNTPWIPRANLKVSFVALWQTEEYKNIAPLERVRLCDTVSIYYPALGVNAQAKVIEIVWNVLLDRYDSMELGDARMSFAETIISQSESTTKVMLSENNSVMQKAIDYATDQITGGMGGNIVLTRDANGDPIELLLMDTKDKTTAVNVWRWNIGGLGHSHDGYDGPFGDFAITQDGYINANYITVGHMRCNILQGGILTLGGLEDGNGVLQVCDANGTVVATIDKTGVNIDEGTIQINTDGNNYCHINKQGFRLQVNESKVYTGKIIYSNYPYFDDPEVELGYLGFDYNTSSVFSQISPLNISFYHNTFGYADMFPSHITAGNKANTAYVDIRCVPYSGQSVYAHFQNIPVVIRSDLTVSGTKNRVVGTGDYGERLMYCYEMPSPMFGDVGEGVIADDGKCYVMVDQMFAETVSLSQYQVFLQKYGDGDCRVSKRNGTYFIVEGTPGLQFAWEIKAKQSDYDQRRLDEYVEEIPICNNIDYAGQLENHINKIKTDREVA